MLKFAPESNPAFRDFNFSAMWDPAMCKGPTEAELIVLVYRGKLGDPDALPRFADAMFYTLRSAALDAYQRFHGPFGITYEEWYYAKLQQFFRILIHGIVSITGILPDDVQYTTVPLPRLASFTGFGFAYLSCRGDTVHADEIKAALAPEANDAKIWFELARTFSKTRADELQLVQEWLRGCRKRQKSSASKGRVWGKNQERDSVIRKCSKDGMSRADSCKELDKRAISTIRALQKREIHRWVEGWADPQGRKSIQSLSQR